MLEIGKRALLSTSRRIKEMVKGQLPKRDSYQMVATLIFAGILTIAFPIYASLEGTFGYFALWTIVINIGVFFYREYKILKREELYRNNVKVVYKIAEEANKLIPQNEPIKKELNYVSLTNEDAYNNFSKSLDSLKESFELETGEKMVSEVSLKEAVHPLKNVVDDSLFKIQDIFNCPHYRVHPDMESWLQNRALPVAHAAQENVQFLYQALDSFQNARMPIKVGHEGELQVQSFLEDFKDSLNPAYGIRFQSDKGTVENDVLLFSKYGIISLEIKNIGKNGNKKLKITKDGLWYEWKYNDWIKSDRDKIFDQVNRHTALTEQIIRKQFGDNEKYHVRSIIVIPNTNVEIVNESNFEIVRPNQLIPLIRSFPTILEKVEAKELERYMKSIDIGQGTFEHLDAQDTTKKIINVYDQLLEQVQFLEKMSSIQVTYVQNINEQKIGEYLRWKQINMDTKRSVI